MSNSQDDTDGVQGITETDIANYLANTPGLLRAPRRAARQRSS